MNVFFSTFLKHRWLNNKENLLVVSALLDNARSQIVEAKDCMNLSDTKRRDELENIVSKLANMTRELLEEYLKEEDHANSERGH